MLSAGSTKSASSSHSDNMCSPLVQFQTVSVISSQNPLTHLFTPRSDGIYLINETIVDSDRLSAFSKGLLWLSLDVSEEEESTSLVRDPARHDKHPSSNSKHQDTGGMLDTDTDGLEEVGRRFGHEALHNASA